jgi:hypothetical protein
MRKLRLDVEQLVVDSFSTMMHGEGPRGTVRGRGDTEHPSCANTCEGCGITNNCMDYSVYCSRSGGEGCWCPLDGESPAFSREC